MIKFDKEKKLITIGLEDEEKEKSLEKWTFIQIYKSSSNRYIDVNLGKKKENIQHVAFE
ncbi:hypothetical protein [Atopobacter sp. AH10]|uniref:hypothetical protein n=1 Tax=Atopobacter sp. AH10 TaxID=2315861 RepID=UPI001314E9ED|nr:hypothetical protein [Atopobacter sp. AH10]